MIVSAVILAILLVSRSDASTEAPNAAAIVAKMKAVMEPTRSSVRDIHITVRGADGSSLHWTAEQVRAPVKGGSAVLTVVTSPEGVKGNALLIRDDGDGQEHEWVYIPAVRRVRELVYGNKNQSFLGTDLTYEDLGFVHPTHRWYTLVREEKYRDKKAYVVREDPADKSVYSRIDVWVAQDDFLPLKREYYDPAGLLWRVAEYANPTVIEGVPTILEVKLQDVQEGGSTELKVHEVRIGVTVPDDLFLPDNLPHALESPFWQSE